MNLLKKINKIELMKLIIYLKRKKINIISKKLTLKKNLEKGIEVLEMSIKIKIVLLILMIRKIII